MADDCIMVTEQDYELLSAYVDGMLSETERANLESRLRAESELRRELDDMRMTIALIKGLPILKAPHNFAVGSHVMRQPVSRWLVFPISAAFSALSAVAAAMLIAISGILLNQGFTQPFAPLASSQQRPGQQEGIALVPASTEMPSEDRATGEDIGDETAQNLFAGETATALAPLFSQVGASPTEETSSDQEAGGFIASAPLPTLESEVENMLLATSVALQFAPSDANVPATVIADGFLLATALPESGGATISQAEATVPPPAASMIQEAVITVTPVLELSRESQATRLPQSTLLPPATTTQSVTATQQPTVPLPTQVAMVATPVQTSGESEDVVLSTVVPVTLLLLGLVLLVVAIGTTLARRRS